MTSASRASDNPRAVRRSAAFSATALVGGYRRAGQAQQRAFLLDRLARRVDRPNGVVADLLFERVQRAVELFAAGAQDPRADAFVGFKSVGHVDSFLDGQLPRHATFTPSSESIVSGSGAPSQTVFIVGPPWGSWQCREP